MLIFLVFYRNTILLIFIFKKLARAFDLNRKVYLVRITMRKKRTISVRHPQLVRFRNALREVISTAKRVETRKLLDEGKGLRPTESEADGKRVWELSDKQSKLAYAWDSSICVCVLCGSRTCDMTFNSHMKEWFCVKCYEKYHRFYERKAKEGELWYGEDFPHTPSSEWWP